MQEETGVSVGVAVVPGSEEERGKRRDICMSRMQFQVYIHPNAACQGYCGDAKKSERVLLSMSEGRGGKNGSWGT